MEIICDTHIWYYIGNGEIKEIPKNSRLFATYNSIDEFSRTLNLINHQEYTVKGVQSMFKYSNKHAIYEPPLIYLKKLSDPTFEYNVKENVGNILLFTEKIAKGHSINLSKTNEFKEFCDERKRDLENVSKLFNDQSGTIKPRIKDLKKHRNENSIPLNRQLISLFVARATNSHGLPQDFDWGKIELFESVLKAYLNALETGEFQSKSNDWYDLFLLIYVQPGRKIWTREKRWINLISRVGMQDYLFDESKIKI